MLMVTCIKDFIMIAGHEHRHAFNETYPNMKVVISFNTCKHV